jgi:hypothetical protein
MRNSTLLQGRGGELRMTLGGSSSKPCVLYIQRAAHCNMKHTKPSLTLWRHSVNTRCCRHDGTESHKGHAVVKLAGARDVRSAF